MNLVRSSEPPEGPAGSTIAQPAAVQAAAVQAAAVQPAAVQPAAVQPAAVQAAASESSETRVDPRMMAAWREWLAALATDAEAAIAAAHVYAELDGAVRDAWLDALSEDAPKLDVPAVAVYAPLLAVESDAGRRDRIHRAIGDDFEPPSRRNARALRGIAADGTRVVMLIARLYLDFVQVLSCRFSTQRGLVWVRHEPICRGEDVPCDEVCIEGTALEATPLKVVVEELAHAILAERRSDKAMPRALCGFAGLFDAQVDVDDLV